MYVCRRRAAGEVDSPGQRPGIPDADRDALPLPAARGLHHDLAHLDEERGVRLVAVRGRALRHA
jgi:hypothetical protein